MENLGNVQKALESAATYAESIAQDISDNTPAGVMLTDSVQRRFDRTCNIAIDIQEALKELQAYKDRLESEAEQEKEVCRFAQRLHEEGILGTLNKQKVVDAMQKHIALLVTKDNNK